MIRESEIRISTPPRPSPALLNLRQPLRFLGAFQITILSNDPNVQVLLEQ